MDEQWCARMAALVKRILPRSEKDQVEEGISLLMQYAEKSDPMVELPYGIRITSIQYREIQLLAPIQKLNAIKRLRECTGIGFKEAKEIVDQIRKEIEIGKKRIEKNIQ